MLFYMKCLSTPFVLTALVWFVVRMYLNDLYVSIPDRLLIIAGFVQFLQNIPTEVLLTHWPVAYLKILDDFMFLCLLCVLLLFWAVYTQDKVAKNEPWERNTKYYDKVILAVVFGTIMSN